MKERIRITNETLNCYGTWIVTGGLAMEQFKRNPVMLWMHMRGVIIGYVDDVRTNGDEVTGVPVFDEASEESRRAKVQWEKGSLRMGSPCFEVIETSDAPELKKPGQTMPTITKAKLLEFSLVDIGGNDDNIRLVYAGEQLDQESAGVKLALAMNKNLINNSKMNEHELKAIALMLGLPSAASTVDVQREVKRLLAESEECAKLRARVSELNGEIKSLRSAGITSMVDEAIAEGKMTADNREHFIELGEKVGAESLKLTLGAMRGGAKPSMLLNKRTDTSGEKKWVDLSDEELRLLRDENPEKYKKLYKEEFGVECII